MNWTPAKVLLGALAVVVGSTGILVTIGGYGTLLSQAILLSSWAIVARFTTARFADQHHVAVWCVAALVNSLLFLLPALVVVAATRRRRPQLGMGLLVLYAITYLALLFLFFPAQDGP